MHIKNVFVPNGRKKFKDSCDAIKALLSGRAIKTIKYKNTVEAPFELTLFYLVFVLRLFCRIRIFEKLQL